MLLLSFFLFGEVLADFDPFGDMMLSDILPANVTTPRRGFYVFPAWPVLYYVELVPSSITLSIVGCSFIFGSS